MVGSTRVAGDDAAAYAPRRTWLEALPGVAVRWVERLDAVPLEQADLLWLREPVPHVQRLHGWLEAGGRLFATQEATVVVSALELESALPATVPLPDPLPVDFGLAAFGSHPLFAGLRDGAVLSSPAYGGLAARGYTHWPKAAVVAVERRGFALDPGRVLAWEYPVGNGGVLCLGLDPWPASGAARDVELLLANALVGDGIPHRDRLSPATHWPRPGTRAIRASPEARASTAVLHATPDDAWPRGTLAALDRTPTAEWVHAGRRQIIRARATGEREVWAPPVRVLHEAAVRGAIPCAPAQIAPDEVTGGLALGGHRLLERWLAAADAPVAVWEVGGREGKEVVMEWSVDLRRAWPYPPGSYGDLTFEVAGDRRSLRVQSEAGPRACYAVTGGALAVEANAGQASIRVTCTGTTPLRLVVAAGADEAELARAVQAVAGGVQELATARARKAAQLDRHGTIFECEDALLARGFAWARQRGDESLIGVPGVGRALLASCPRSPEEGAWCFGAETCAAAAAQLIAGNRDPARDLIQFLAQAQHPDGGIPAELPLGGLASPPDAGSTVAFLGLAERLAAWTGEVESPRGLGASLGRALAFLSSRPSGGPALARHVLDGIETLVDGGTTGAALARLRARAPVARAVPDVEPHAVVEAAAAALRRAPGHLVGSDAGPALLEAVAALWGLEPAATEGALALAPIVPASWPGHALRGLRVGRSVLDLEVRQQAAALVVRVHHRFGPRLVLTVVARGVEVIAMDVDDVVLTGARARFEAHARHDVRFHLAG